MNEDGPRDFTDRLLCDALSKPENLRGLLRNAAAIFKADDAELEEAQRLFRRIFQKIDPLHDTGRVQWRDLLKLILGWAQNRRPNVERQSWSELSDKLETIGDNRREIQIMAITIAQSLQQEARREGLQEGLLRGKLSTLRRQGAKRFGPPSEQQAAELNTLTDIDRLDRMLDQVNEVHAWGDVLKIE